MKKRTVYKIKNQNLIKLKKFCDKKPEYKNILQLWQKLK